MEKTPFILNEKFRSDNNEQRKEHFQKKFERYIVDELSNTAPSKSCAWFGILEFEERMRYVAHGRLCTKRKVQIMKAAIYCRLSKEDEYKIGESESIQNQKSMLIQYAIEKGFDIYQIYSDEDYSGIDRNRPAFNSMIQAASEHKFDVVLAKTQSRFTRDMELVE